MQTGGTEATPIVKGSVAAPDPFHFRHPGLFQLNGSGSDIGLMKKLAKSQKKKTYYKNLIISLP